MTKRSTGSCRSAKGEQEWGWGGQCMQAAITMLGESPAALCPLLLPYEVLHPMVWMLRGRRVEDCCCQGPICWAPALSLLGQLPAPSVALLGHCKGRGLIVAVTFDYSSTDATVHNTPSEATPASH